MEFQFSPAFEPLIKFVAGLPKVPISEEDVVAVANYLGVDLPSATSANAVTLLSEALLSQDGFLSTHLSSELIFDTDEYRKSAYIREIVTNNRINLAIRRFRGD